MSGQTEGPYGISREEWEAAYRAGIAEFAATRFVARIGSGLVRIVFGIEGPPTDERGTTGSPVYTHAVTLTPDLAIQLSKLLRDVLAQPTAKDH